MIVQQAIPGDARREPLVVPQRFYRPELDMLRWFAFLMVFAAHALLSFHGLLPAAVLSTLEGAGSCGVPIFFFLSAFLITELLRREKLAGTVPLRSFYVRRILRIWPLYFGILAAYAVLGRRFHGFHVEAGRLLLNCLLAGNWYIALHPAITTPLRSLWSISVEEQWYLFWPVLQRGLSRAALFLSCIVIAVLAYVALIAIARTGDPRSLPVTAWVDSAVQFQYFALGAATALCLQGRVPRVSRGARCLMLALGVVLMLLAAGVCGIKQAVPARSTGALVSGYLLVAGGTLCCFLAVLGIASRRWLRPLVRLGQLSFGLYVFHETGFFLADALRRYLEVSLTLGSLLVEKAVALLLTCGMAFCSYHWWERPFLRLKQRWTVVPSRAVH